MSPGHKRQVVQRVMTQRKQASAWEEDDWAFAADENSPSQRDFSAEYTYKPKNVKILARCLRSTMMALGHAHSAHARFSKLKSVDISPDGNLGGRGYINQIPQMRRQYANVVEALSSLSDTLYDEIRAPHWQEVEEALPPAEKKEVEDIVDDVEDIREDPEGWAQEEEEEEDLEEMASETLDTETGKKKKASTAFEKLYFGLE